LSITRHIIPDEWVEPHWDCNRSYDFGFSAPYSVLWFAEANGESYGDFNPPKGSIIVVRYIYGADSQGYGLRETVSQVAAKIHKMESTKYMRRFRIYPGPADASIFDKDRGPSIAEQFPLCGISWFPSVKTPGSRINGLAVARQMIRNVVDGEGPGLYFTESCRPVVSNLLALPLNEDGEDVDTGADDHHWDALRYRLLEKDMRVILRPVMGL